MFDFVRSHSRLMLALMVLLIFPSFVFFGIQGYSRFTDAAAADVAKVDGRGITRAEWDAAHQRQIERARRQMPGLDTKLFDTPEMRRQTLDALVQERVLLAAANGLHLAPGDERLERLFKTDPNFAGVRNPDGSVNRDILAMQGMSSEMFAQQLRQDLAMQQVVAGVRNTAFAPVKTAAVSFDAFMQRREVQYENFLAAAYAAKVSPSDADLEAYYKLNTASFMAPETAAIEYTVLDLAVLGKDLQVPEADARKFYEDNAARFGVPEERRASHILIKADKDKPADERAKARARAEALLAEVRKSPGSFAELARKNSEDTGSAAQGGDLDFFGRGAMVKPFEDAAFAMKQGEISNVIETDFGYHVLMLTGVRGGDKKPFDAVRAEIEAELRRTLAQKRFAEAAEQFTNTVYEQSDSLKPVIDKLKLEKRTATVARTPDPAASGPLASEKLLGAVFSNDVLRNKRNTEAIETGPSQLAAARIVSHTPARTLPLDEVKDRVRQRVVAAQAAAMARKEGEAKLALVRQAEAPALPASAVVSRVKPQGLPRTAIESILRLDAANLPAAIGVDLADQGYLVAKVAKVLPREAAPEGDANLRVQYTQAWANAETDSYFASLKKRYKAQVKPGALTAAAQAASGAAP